MAEPKVRFKNDNGGCYPAWQEYKLADILKERNELHLITADAPQLSFTIEQGVIYPEEKKTNKRDFLIKDKNNKKFLLTEYNDIIYNPANLKFGAIHRNTLGRGVVSPIYAIFSTNQSPEFVEGIVTNPVFIKRSMKYLEGTVEKLKTLKPKDFVQMHVWIPCIEEQKKIANFLSTVDDIIASSEEEVTNLETQKTAVAKKIFSQEVSFKRDDGSDYPEWQQKSLGEIAEIVGGGTPDTSVGPYWEPGTIDWFTPTEIGREKYVDTSKRKISPLGLSKSSAKILPSGTILLTSRATIGEMSIAGTECCTNQGFQSLVVHDGINNEFVYYNQPLIKEYGLKHAAGSTFLEISSSNIAKCPIRIPCLEEQCLIVEFLSCYDEAISTAKKELDLWKELKKGLLQQMFV